MFEDSLGYTVLLACPEISLLVSLGASARCSIIVTQVINLCIKVPSKMLKS